MKLRITSTIANEYDDRSPDYLPLDKLREGWVELTEAEVRAVLEDALFNSDTDAFNVGEYGMPLGTFNAYRALAKQCRKVLGEGA